MNDTITAVTARVRSIDPYELWTPVFYVWWIGHTLRTVRRMERVITR